MKMNSIAYKILIIMLLVSHYSCNKNSPNEIVINNAFLISDFQPIANWDSVNPIFKIKDSSFSLYIDYTNAIDSGFSIPTNRQITNGVFQFSFIITNNSGSDKQYYYKIYFQNESYKFQEFDEFNGNIENEYAHENFYGSWTNPELGFKQTTSIKSGDSMQIFDEFAIIGNPRNEEKYFFEGENDRWKRNPRTGEYSFLLIVSDKKSVVDSIIPDYIKNITIQKKNKFINPYFYFLYGDGKQISNLKVIQPEFRLNLIAKPDLSKGIYIDNSLFNSSTLDTSFFNSSCSNNILNYKSSPISQFLHHIDAETELVNVPLIEDVIRNGFSKKEYFYSKSFLRKMSLLKFYRVLQIVPVKQLNMILLGMLLL